MKILMMTDLEGVAGVVSFAPQVFDTSPYYAQAKQLLTGEINAAAEGLLEAGATEILVIDGHGAGGVCYEELHPALRLLHGRPLIPPTQWGSYFAGYDAGIMIGQHAMAGVRTANMNHTQSADAIDWFKFNGKLVGEIFQFALFIGGMGIPMIYLSGDQAACEEAKQLLPDLVTTSVKLGVGRNSAISCSIPDVRQRIRTDVAAALRKQQQQSRPPLQPAGPHVLEKRFFHTDFADAVESAGYERVDSQTVRKRGDNLSSVIYS